MFYLVVFSVLDYHKNFIISSLVITEWRYFKSIILFSFINQTLLKTLHSMVNPRYSSYRKIRVGTPGCLSC